RSGKFGEAPTAFVKKPRRTVNDFATRTGTDCATLSIMKSLVCACLVLFPLAIMAEETSPAFDAKAAQRFADLALGCVAKEYPNHISHTLNGDADVAPPRRLTPAFYGCYDWHSSVHGHWLLARLARTHPDATVVVSARDALRQSLTAENIAQEAAYLRGEGHANSIRMTEIARSGTNLPARIFFHRASPKRTQCDACCQRMSLRIG